MSVAASRGTRRLLLGAAAALALCFGAFFLLDESEASASPGAAALRRPRAWFLKAPKLPEYKFLQEWMESLMEGLRSDHDVQPVQADTSFMRGADLQHDLFVGVGYVPPEWLKLATTKMSRVWLAYGERDHEGFDMLLKGIGILCFSLGQRAKILEQAPMKRWREIPVEQAVRWLPVIPSKFRGISLSKLPGPVATVTFRQCFEGWDFGRRQEMNKRVQKEVGDLFIVRGFGKKREKRLPQCGILLNIHAYEWWPEFEHLRCIWPWLYGTQIVSERSSRQDEEFFGDTVVFAEYDKLPETLLAIKKKQEGKNLTELVLQRRRRVEPVFEKMMLEYDATLEALRQPFGVKPSSS